MNVAKLDGIRADVGVLNENSANIQGENCMAGHTTSHVNSFFGQKTYKRTVSKLRKN